MIILTLPPFFILLIHRKDENATNPNYKQPEVLKNKYHWAANKLGIGYHKSETKTSGSAGTTLESFVQAGNSSQSSQNSSQQNSQLKTASFSKFQASSVVVSGLPHDIRRDEIEVLFNASGKIREINIISRNSKFSSATVTFSAPEMVPVAISQYNGVDIGDGCVLSVCKATEDQKSTAANTFDFNLERWSMVIENLPDDIIPFILDLNNVVITFNWFSNLESLQLESIVSNSKNKTFDDILTDLEADILLQCVKFGNVAKIIILEEFKDEILKKLKSRGIILDFMPQILNGVVLIAFQDSNSAGSCFENLQGKEFRSKRIISPLRPALKSSTNAKPTGGDSNSETVQEIEDNNIDDFLNSLL